MKVTFSTWLPGLLLLASLEAQANPRVFPFSYEPRTLQPKELEFEQYVDLSPVRVARQHDSGTEAVTSLRSELQTELEVGLTDRLEAAWYFAFTQPANPERPTLQFRGVKQRLRARLSPITGWPLDLGVYVETAQFHSELEFEEKLLIGRHFGRLRLASNLWFEQEYYFQLGEWKHWYNPTVAASFELDPRAIVGCEYWARGRLDKPRRMAGTLDPGASQERTVHYVGPTLLLQQGHQFLTLGGYLRVDNLERAVDVGDAWGRIWARAIIGIGL